MGFFNWMRRRDEALEEEMAQLVWESRQRHDPIHQIYQAEREAREAFFGAKNAAEKRLPKDEENLSAWRASGEPRRWVEVHGGQWNHNEWLSLLSQLQDSRWWPMRPEGVGRVLELEREAPAKADQLITLLRRGGYDEHWFSAARRLLELGHPKGATALIQDLGSIKNDVHEVVEIVVTKIGDQRAVPLLLDRIEIYRTEAPRVERMLRAIVERHLRHVRTEDLMVCQQLRGVTESGDAVREMAREELARRNP